MKRTFNKNMQPLFFLIGCALVSVAYIIIGARAEYVRRNFHNLVPKWLSKDKPFETFEGGYIIYANGSRWYIETFITFKLVWLPFYENDELSKLITTKSWIEYQCTWLPRRTMYRACKKIINTHPNLKPPNMYWWTVKTFEL